MSFSNELHEVTNQANANKLTPFQEVINSFRWRLQEKCKKAAKEGKNNMKTSFYGSYVTYDGKDVTHTRDVSRFVDFEDAIPYKDATIEIIKELGFVSYKVEIKQCELYMTKGLFSNGVRYFFKEMFDRDYEIEIYVEW